MIKVRDRWCAFNLCENVITLGKLIGLLILFCHPFLSIFFENSKNKRNDLARPVMGTILFYLLFCLCLSWAKMHRWNNVALTHACSKSVLGSLRHSRYSFRLCARAALGCTKKNIHFEMGNLKQTGLQGQKTEERKGEYKMRI